MQGEIKYVDRIVQGAGRAVASVRLARAQAITLAHFSGVMVRADLVQ